MQMTPTLSDTLMVRCHCNLTGNVLEKTWKVTNLYYKNNCKLNTIISIRIGFDTYTNRHFEGKRILMHR